MHVKFVDKTTQTTTLKSYYAYKKRHLRIIDFKPQTSHSDCTFKKIRFLRSQTL